jgi:1,4-dihydroxy-2-naphthoate octaprenyltransferase
MSVPASDLKASAPALWRAWLGLVRGPFLWLVPACLSPAMVAAWLHGGPAQRADMPVLAVLTLVSALCAHISVNALNEWGDFRSGLDQHTRRTPFSGGSGTLLVRPELLPLAGWTGLLALLVSILSGLVLVAHWAQAWPWLAPLGGLGVVIVLSYTGWVTRHPWLCLVAPGLGFGPLMVAGSEFALLGRYTWDAWVASALTFFLVNNLLLLNQFPDVDADRQAGRVTLPILLGRQRCARVLVWQWAAAYACVLLAVLAGVLPWGALAALCSAPLAWVVGRQVLAHANEPPALLPAMGLNVGITLATPVLLALGWWFTGGNP